MWDEHINLVPKMLSDTQKFLTEFRFTTNDEKSLSAEEWLSQKPSEYIVLPSTRTDGLSDVFFPCYDHRLYSVDLQSGFEIKGREDSIPLGMFLYLINHSQGFMVLQTIANAILLDNAIKSFTRIAQVHPPISAMATEVVKLLQHRPIEVQGYCDVSSVEEAIHLLSGQLAFGDFIADPPYWQNLTDDELNHRKRFDDIQSAFLLLNRLSFLKTHSEVEDGIAPPDKAVKCLIAVCKENKPSSLLTGSVLDSSFLSLSALQEDVIGFCEDSYGILRETEQNDDIKVPFFDITFGLYKTIYEAQYSHHCSEIPSSQIGFDHEPF